MKKEKKIKKEKKRRFKKWWDNSLIDFTIKSIKSINKFFR